MGGNPCRLKIILNGDTIIGETSYIQREAADAEIPEDVGYKMVEALNEAENAVFRAKRLFLESQGFTGPWPNSMCEEGEK